LATATATGLWTLAWMYFRPQVQWFVATFGGDWIVGILAVVFTIVILRVVLSLLKDLRNFRRIERRRAEIARRLQAGTVVQVLHAETEGAKRDTPTQSPKAHQAEAGDSAATDA
jgi:uncharacterized membrane protein YcjF (UPF0283 family)